MLDPEQENGVERGFLVLGLVPVVVQHLNGLQDRFRSFCRHGVQLEGWFKGELFVLFDALKTKGEIRDFDREVKLGRGRVDLKLTLGDGCHWVELKQWLVGDQRGTRYGPSNYLGDAQAGILKDVKKLISVPPGDHTWILILLCANPGTRSWREGVQTFHETFGPLRVRSHTKPRYYRPSYFLGLLEVQRLRAGV
jgi:hypothetical protein